MKISVVQPDIFWEDKSRNLQLLSCIIEPLVNNTDIVILPEMFNTGFSVDPGRLFEMPDGLTFDWMKNLAEKGNFGICGSYIVKDGSNFFNRWVFMSPAGESWYYNKRHLFSIGGENEFFTAGDDKLHFSFRGIKISAYICYDLRFPVWSRNTGDADLIIYAANWPESRRNVWSTLLKARAIENQCYVAGSNRTGTDGAGIKYCGESMIIHPKGGVIATAGRVSDIAVTTELSVEELNDFRKKFPVGRDSDRFTIDS